MTPWFSLARASAVGAIALAALAGSSSAASAQTATIIGERDAAVPMERVSYRDLDLRQAGDEKILVTRVRGAVRRVCSLEPDTYPYIDCRSFAWSNAKSQIGRAVKQARVLAHDGTAHLAPMAILVAAPR